MDKVIAALRKAAGRLLYPSETDAPFEPFIWGQSKNTAAAVRKFAKLSRADKCQQISLDDFFGDLMEEKKFQALRAALESILSDLKAYRCGAINVTYWIVGTTPKGELAGLKTTAVET